FPDNFLFDDGDTIQGTPLADYQAKVKPVACDEELAVYRALDAMGYDGGTAGNHEFNYGLPFLSQVTGTPMNVDGGRAERCAGPHFPLVLSNVDSARDGQPIFQPWTIVSKDITATGADGRTRRVPLKIAIIGFTPPPILEWDKQNLEGKVTVSGVVEAAQRYLPQIQARHPDLVIGILHGGLNASPYTPMMENGGWYLAGVPGIDVLLLGHSHTEFPGPRFANLPEVDAVRGLVRGKPAVMGGFYGKDLGVIDLGLTWRDGRWRIDPARTRSQVRPACASKDRCVAPDPQIAAVVKDVHAATLAYVATPIASTEVRLSSYFAEQGNDTALAAVAAAQLAWLRDNVKNILPQYAGLPILASASPFRTGFAGPEDYTDVEPGTVSLRSIADLYYYPNTLNVVKLDGAGIKAWLEQAATRYNRIDPAAGGEQPLLDDKKVSYNNDRLYGELRYTIDLSRPEGQRIAGLTWRGKPVDPKQSFLVATNNYRASGGGGFPGLDGSSIVYAGQDEIRQILADWLRRRGTLTAADLGARTWSFAPLKTAGPVVFPCPPGKLDLARAAGVAGLRELQDNGDGSGRCAIDLAKRR
ncbi:MAG: 5'-nucleotidase C-terminal domain-containing protein, partial [Pseudoxanthomonas sp.]